jgi:hypothetical protein
MRITGCVAAVLFMVACSSSGGSANGDAAANRSGSCGTAVSTNACIYGCNPCTRLSDAQVAAAVGQSAVPGQWNGDACVWDFYDAQNNLLFEVSLDVNTDFRTFEDLCYPGSTAGITITPVSGVGDDACYMGTGVAALGSFDLEFLKGCWGYSVTIAGLPGHASPFSDAAAQAAEKALALDAVPNL